MANRRNWLHYIERARVEFQNENHAVALRHFENARNSPGNDSQSSLDRAMLLSNISACHIMLKDARSAINAARESVRIHPSYAKGYIRLATALIFQTSGNANCDDTVRPNNNSNAACQALQTALRYDPDNRWARKMLLNELRARDVSPSQPSDLHEQGPVQLDGPNAGNADILQPRSVNLDEPDPMRLLLQQRLREHYQAFRYKSLLHWSLLYVALYVSFGGRFGFGITPKKLSTTVNQPKYQELLGRSATFYPAAPNPPSQPTFQRVIPTYERVLAASHTTNQEKRSPQPNHQTFDKHYSTPNKKPYHKTKSRVYNADSQSTMLSLGAIIIFSALVAHWTGRDPLMAVGMVILRYCTPRRHRARGRWR